MQFSKTPLNAMIVALAGALLPCGSGFARVGDEPPSLVPRPLPASASPRVPLSACGGWTDFYGIFDYREASAGVRWRVESRHFDEYMPKYLAWPANQPFDRYIAANLAYTLRAFPNHPTALLVMEQIGRRLKTEDIPGSYYPLECWYTRALQTVPGDPMVPALYGIYLANRDRREEALVQLETGDRGLCLHRTMQYQIGLAYARVGEWSAAQRSALRAERLGFPLPALKEQIRAAGKWDANLHLPEGRELDCASTEAQPAAPVAASAASAAAPGAARN